MKAKPKTSLANPLVKNSIQSVFYSIPLSSASFTIDKKLILDQQVIFFFFRRVFDKIV